MSHPGNPTTATTPALPSPTRLFQNKLFTIDDDEDVWKNFDKPSATAVVAYTYSLRSKNTSSDGGGRGVVRQNTDLETHGAVSQPADIDSDSEDGSQNSPSLPPDTDVVQEGEEEETDGAARSEDENSDAGQDADVDLNADDFRVVSKEQLWTLLQEDVKNKLSNTDGTLRVVEFDGCDEKNMKEMVEILAPKSISRTNDRAIMNELSSFVGAEPKDGQQFYIGKQIRGYEDDDFSIVFISLPIFSINNRHSSASLSPAKFFDGATTTTTTIPGVSVHRACFLAFSNDTVAIFQEAGQWKHPNVLPGQPRQGALHFLAQAIAAVVQESDEALVQALTASFYTIQTALSKALLDLSTQAATATIASATTDPDLQPALSALRAYATATHHADAITRLLAQQAAILEGLHSFLYCSISLKFQENRTTADGCYIAMPLLSSLTEQMSYVLPILRNAVKQRQKLATRIEATQDSSRRTHALLLPFVRQSADDRIVAALEKSRVEVVAAVAALAEKNAQDLLQLKEALVGVIEAGPATAAQHKDDIVTAIKDGLTNAEQHKDDIVTAIGTGPNTANAHNLAIVTAIQEGPTNAEKHKDDIITAISTSPSTAAIVTAIQEGPTTAAQHKIDITTAVNEGTANAEKYKNDIVIAIEEGSKRGAQVNLEPLLTKILGTARASKDELASQGELFSFFTVVTTIFLPLAFFTQYFALDLGKDISKTHGGFWQISGPFSGVFCLFVILLVGFKKEYSMLEVMRTFLWDWPRAMLTCGRRGKMRWPKTRRQEDDRREDLKELCEVDPHLMELGRLNEVRVMEGNQARFERSYDKIQKTEEEKYHKVHKSAWDQERKLTTKTNGTKWPESLRMKWKGPSDPPGLPIAIVGQPSGGTGGLSGGSGTPASGISTGGGAGAQGGAQGGAQTGGTAGIAIAIKLWKRWGW